MSKKNTEGKCQRCGKFHERGARKCQVGPPVPPYIIWRMKKYPCLKKMFEEFK